MTKKSKKEKPISVGVIGVGRGMAFARSATAELGMKLVALCDIWEEKLKDSSFMKVHRTTIVNLSKIDHIEGNLIQIGAHKLTVSEQYKVQLLERMFGGNATSHK